ncbi:protein of unknown function [Candidatus Methylocalor cossyra]|uniref:Uncharacterized protein n=1 Tax=Candidatus Methylocalor cossyra TaxID=3108543 RepID=A0ABM9NKP8_9GAMM
MSADGARLPWGRSALAEVGLGLDARGFSIPHSAPDSAS